MFRRERERVIERVVNKSALTFINETMKILHILDHSLPLHSGYTFRSQNIFQAQQAMGFEPVVLTSPKHEQSWKGERIAVESINGFTYYRTGAVSGNGFLPALPEYRLMKALGKRLEQVLDLENPDLIHAHSPFLNAMAVLKPARARGIPVVYEIRAFWEDAAVDHRTYQEHSWKYNLVRSMETRVCRRADHVAVLCNGLKNDLINRGIPASRITPVFNGVNPESFKPSPPDQEFQHQYGLEGKTVIGFIGSFYRYEGLDLLIKAFAQLAPHHPDLVLLLVGGGEMESELKQLVHDLDSASASALRPSSFPASLRSFAATCPASQPPSLCRPPSFQASQPPSGTLRSRVMFPGRIPHERIPGIYALIDILAYPRYSMRLTDLVTPLKPLEAMAMGKPLVASDVGGHKELIRDGENGVLFEAGNEQGLAEALQRYLNEGTLMQQISQQASKWVVEHHSWSKTTSVYKDIYHSISSKD